MDETSFFDSPIFWGFVTGFGLGAIFCCMSLFAHWKTKRELKRYQQHLSDKLQIEAEQFSALKKQADEIKLENEHLRLKIGTGKSADPIESLERELEIFARAERRMVVSAPGFASAWETAKSAAHDEIVEEERGKSLPRRLFRKFFPGSNGDGSKPTSARIGTSKVYDGEGSDHEGHDHDNAADTEHPEEAGSASAER